MTVQEKLKKQLVETSGEIVKDVTEDLIRPSSKSIGDNLGLLVDGVFGWLGVWGQKQKIMQTVNIDNFKKLLSNKISNITNDNIKEPSINIAGPAIESLKFYYEEAYYKEMFSNLIAASCDKSKENEIHPSYIEIIKQLSPLDAKILKLINDYSTSFPVMKLGLKSPNGSLLPEIPTILFEGSDEIYAGISEYTISIENLQRLQIINFNFKTIAYPNSRYDNIRNKREYNETKNILDSYSIEFDEIKGVANITTYGNNFIKVCL